VKAKCDGVGLARTILKKHGMRIDKNPEETLWRRSRIRVKASQLLVMPSFNDFLGGRPLNEGKGTFVGPLLHSEAVHVETAEIFLVDGTFLGRLDALRTMS
jgi:metallophosphoesterase superfamily enzyme